MKDTRSFAERLAAQKKLDKENACCLPAQRSAFGRHSKNCRVHLPWEHPTRVKERAREKAARKQKRDDDDIGQGEGCEGGKCSIERK